MASPWEQTWSDVKQGAEEAVANVKTEAIRALPWLQKWTGDTQPSPAPVKPPVEAVKAPSGQLQNDPDGFWSNLKQKWHTEAPQRQAEITKIKQAEWGEELPAAVKNLESLLSKKNLDGTVRRILRTEYRDLTGKDYNSRIQASPVKPLSGLQHDGVANPEVPSFVEAMGSVASRAGDKILDVASNAGLGVNASAALATAGEMVADPLNLIPGGKGVAALGVLGAFKKSAHEIAIPLTKAEKSFVKEGAFSDQWSEFVKHEGIKWFDKPNFRVFGDELTYHPQDNAVVEKFFKWLSETPAGERKGIPPKFLSGSRENSAAIVGAEKTVLPTVTNSIYSKFPGQALKDTKYVQRNVRESAELADMLKTGYLLPKPGGKSQKYFTAVDEVNPDVPAGNTMIRILRDKVKPTEPVSVKDVEVFNFKLGSWEPLVKGK